MRIMETIQIIKEELKIFAVTESMNCQYDLSQETIDIDMDLTRNVHNIIPTSV